MSNFASKINVVSEKDADGFSNEVAIVLDGKPFRFWRDLEVTRSFDTIADTFVLSAPFDPENPEMRDIFRPYKYQECAVYIGGEKVLTGNIIRSKTKTSASSGIVTVNGYSTPGILNDCSVPVSSWPISINGLNLEEIAVKFSGDYGVEVDFKGNPGAKFSKRDKVEIDSREHVYEFLARLARQRGFVLSSDVDGKLLFQKTPTGVKPEVIKAGVDPWTGSDVDFDGQSRFSDITIIKQQTGFGAGQKTTVKDPELTANGILRSTTASAEDTEMGNLQVAGNAQLGRMIANSVKVNLALSSWRKYSNGDLWADADYINFVSPGDMIYKPTDFLVRIVKLTRKTNRLTAAFNLVFPESYSGVVRSDFPWQE